MQPLPLRNMFLRVVFALAAVAPILAARTALAQEKFSIPANPRATFNFNPDWKFIRSEQPGSENPTFNDSAWVTVSTPHTYNDVDSFNHLITHGGQVGGYTGPATYRKHFKLPADAADKKVILEFEGMRQAAHFFLNGKPIGKYENGVNLTALDLTPAAFFGDRENILTVKITNDTGYKEEATGIAYQWSSRDFNPSYGGLNRDIKLHILGKIYQTLPIYDNLKTTGTYIYGSDINVAEKLVKVNVESQVRNETDQPKTIALSAEVVDADGNVRAKIAGESRELAAGATAILKATGPFANVNLWSPDTPNLYDVYTLLTADGKVIDVAKNTTGFRKVEFKGGAGTGGVYINDKFTYLKGYAIRSANEWAAVGGAYPDWMHDYSTALLAATHGNYIRWMHISPQAADVRACDKFGIVQACPAGDKEKDAEGVQWDQRVAVMRNSIIAFRNSPSILMWEAGNSGVTPAHMTQMVALRKELDPSGQRYMGCRTLNDPGTTNITEYFGVMVGQDAKTDQLRTPTEMFRAFSFQRRDIAPFIETEDFRDEAARRFWDNFSPPHFGFKPGPDDTYNLNSESFCVAAATRYWDFYSNIISNTDANHARWSGYCSIIWADSNQHGRQDSSEVCRVSGKVDAVRIPKQAFYAYRVMQSEKPDMHLVGHWTYPADTVKDIIVVANHVTGVELFVNGASVGKQTRPTHGYIYTFPKVAFKPGTIKAVATGEGATLTQEIKTVGPAKSIKLTPYTGPKGLQADGADVAFFDVEVVDADGNRCPTDEARVDFDITGPAIWRGGYNSGKVDSVNNKYLDTECGINRVFIRSTLAPGTIRLTAKREGLAPATIEVQSTAFPVTAGLSAELPPPLKLPLPKSAF